jgi:glutaryl-CoA dehydrogenase (non-decarboxylating)
VDFALTPEQRAVQELARDVADRWIRPRIAELDAQERFDPEILRAMAEAGLLGLCLPERYGGGGLDYVSLALASLEIEKADTAYREILSVHLGLTALGILQWGTREQKERWLPPLARGERVAAFGLTEPGAGSDAAGLTTTARRDGDSYVLNGEKLWISLADVADVFLVFAKTDPGARHQGISAFIVERGTPGLRTGSIRGKLGVRAGNTGSIVFQDCRVAADQRLGEEGEGFRIAMTSLDNGRLTVAGGATGLIEACLEASVTYAQQRHAFGRPIGEYQLVQQMIARMVRDRDAAYLLTMRAAWLKNQGVRNTRETALAKWYASEAAWRAATDAVQIHGAYGFSREFPVERYLRNSKGAVIYEGTSQIQELIQGEYALGLRQDRPLRRELPAWPFGEDV